MSIISCFPGGSAGGGSGNVEGGNAMAGAANTGGGGAFYHEGARVMSRLEQTEAEHAAYEKKLKLQEAQIQALSDRNDFMEDCVAEMAGVVYSGE